MRILKFLTVAFVAVLAAGSLQAQRADSDVQAKAREALQQAETQLDTQTNKVVAPKKKKTQVIVPAAPMVARPAPAATPGALSADAEAKAREQLRQAEADKATQAQAQADADAARAEHLKQLEAARAREAAATPPPPVVVTTPKVEIAPAPVVVNSGGLNSDAEAKAREAMRQAMAASETQSAAPASPAKVGWDKPVSTLKPMPAPAPKVTVRTTVPDTSYPGVPTAPAPAMTGKQARLNDLLNKYKMDQITPQEYFAEKAKILAEP